MPVTTAVAFLSLITAPLADLVPHGHVMAFGVAWSWLLSVTFLPCTLAITRWTPLGSPSDTGTRVEVANKLARFVAERHITVIAVTVCLTIFAALGMPKVAVDMVP